MPRIHETYVVEETAADRLARVARLLRFRVAAMLRECGTDVTPEQWGLMLRLVGDQGRALGDLADPVLADHPNVTRMVDGLARRGLVERRPNPDDRRGVLAVLTAAGKDFLDQVLPQMTEEKERYFKGLERNDVASLNRMLDVLEANLVHLPEE